MKFYKTCHDTAFRMLESGSWASCLDAETLRAHVFFRRLQGPLIGSVGLRPSPTHEKTRRGTALLFSFPSTALSGAMVPMLHTCQECESVAAMNTVFFECHGVRTLGVNSAWFSKVSWVLLRSKIR